METLLMNVSYPLLKEGAFCFFHRLDPRYRVTLVLVSTRIPALCGVFLRGFRNPRGARFWKVYNLRTKGHKTVKNALSTGEL